MPLTPGTRLGVYEVTAQIGEGGMGQVYRARDTKLNRDVALKVLPDSFASDPDRLARFTREAQTLASLNHPNIAHIHGLEESSGVRALVMELVEGDDLSQRIARGAIPPDEALPIAKQIADALEAAHAQGVIHRDLKPANIKLRADGTVKVLDFGLAKAMEHAAGSAPAMSVSPTITTPAMTQAGMILGTAAYMSPEQAKGQVADKRSDVWAFGCVLYEMLTGRRAFESETVAETLALVLTKDPDWSLLPLPVSPAIRALLKRCLERAPRRRVGDVAAVGFVLDEDVNLVAAPGPRDPSSDVDRLGLRRSAMWRRVASISAMALLVGLALGGAAAWQLIRPAPSRVTRLSMPLAGATVFTGSGTSTLALTPDGSRLVYVGNQGTQLLLRALDTIEPVVLATGVGLTSPFVSPDGQWIGYADRAFTLKKVPITGGAPVPLQAVLDATVAGVTWLPDDTIVFATFGQALGLRRASAAEGTPSATPEVLTRPDIAQGEAFHLWPQLLPNGRAVLFTITAQTGGLDAAHIAVLDLRTGKHKVLVSGGSSARYMANPLRAPGAPSGYLVYSAGTVLRAIAFDLATLETRGVAIPVVSRLLPTSRGTVDFSVAADSTLVYVDAGDTPANAPTAPTPLVWITRQGQEERIGAPIHRYLQARVSPDETRLALVVDDQDVGVSVWDLRRQALTPIRLPPGNHATGNAPVWTPDGLRIVFQSAGAGSSGGNLWWAAADGSGVATRLTASANPQAPSGVTPDGKHLVFFEAAPSLDVMQLALDEPQRVTPLVRTKAYEASGVVSPDGRWLAYESDSSGQLEIYVCPYPGTETGQFRVSTLGGRFPRWSRNGRELFFRRLDGAVMRLAAETNRPTWEATVPTVLLEAREFNPVAYDVSADGQRFVMIKAPAVDPHITSPQVIVVQHFDEELKRLVPKK